MTNKSNQITFFGSGPVAANSLELLLKHQGVHAVVTKTSTKSMMQAISKELKVHTVDNKKQLDELIDTGKLPRDVGVLIDFGIIVSQKVIDYFQNGIVNSHFSLLPQWRGADPITFAILSGQQKTGVSLMQLAPGMDTGPIIAQASHSISEEDDSITLTKELVELSDVLLRECLEDYIAGTLLLQEQETSATLNEIDTKPTYSRKLNKDDGVVQWDKPAKIIEREVRAYIEWPKSHAKLKSIEVVLKKTKVADESGRPGNYRKTKNSLIVYCGEQALELVSLQPIGKKEMPVQAFLAGYGSRI